MKRNIIQNIRRNITFLGSAALALALGSCGDFLKESSQDNDYVRSWQDLNELLLGDCYMAANASGDFQTFANPGMFLHLLSDDMEENVGGGKPSSSVDQHEVEFGYLIWQQRVGTSQDYTGYYTENKTWTTIYKYINVANNALVAVAKVPQALDEDVDGARSVAGQAHFLRGFYYFWLTKVYGQPYNPQTAGTDLGVPIKTEPEVRDRYYKRNTVQECYAQVVSDLTKADSLLSLVKAPRKSIYRANATAAELLLSRVYLYMQQWDKAASYAQKVIDRQPDLRNLNEKGDAFMTKDNVENIFSMGGDDLCRFQDYAAQCLRMSNDLFNSYDEDDLRQKQWFWSYATFHGLIKQPSNDNAKTDGPTKPTYYNTWYQLTNKKHDISSLFWLRSGEAYLNLAEARKAVNVLRKARINKQARNIDITSTGSQLIKDLRLERHHEFAGEGHRWFDLRRYRVCAVQPEKISIAHNYTYYKSRGSDIVIETRQYVLTEDDASWTLSIPQEVLNFNVGMKGNGNKYREYKKVPTVK